MLAGTVGAVFFWLSDPRYGLGQRWTAGDRLIDAAHEVFPGTVVGIVGSVVVLLIGLWLVRRRTM